MYVSSFENLNVFSAKYDLFTFCYLRIFYYLLRVFVFRLCILRNQDSLGGGVQAKIKLMSGEGQLKFLLMGGCVSKI